MSRTRSLRAFRAILLLSVLTAAVATHQTAAFPAIPRAGSSAACPITAPNGVNPPHHPPIPTGYGNDVLWSNLAMWGETPGIVPVPNDDRIDPDGTINDMKWAWYLLVPGELAIEGRRLDAPDDPLIAWIPEGYESPGFQVSGLTFPSAGCWEITGIVNDTRLTFVVLVVMPPDWNPEPR